MTASGAIPVRLLEYGRSWNIGDEIQTLAVQQHLAAFDGYVDRDELDRVGGPEAAEELDRSVSLIEDRLGVACRHFAYPKALPGSAAAEQEVRQRFRTAALAGTRPNPYGRTDLHRLHRSPVQVGDGLRWFRRKAAGGLGLEDDLRRLRNRRRYAGAVT